MTTRLKRAIILVLVALSALVALRPAPARADGIETLSDLNDSQRKVGVSTGSISELSVAHELPEAKLAYYDDKFLGYEDVAAGKIDAFVYDRRQLELAIENGREGVRLLDECLEETTKIAVGISGVSKIEGLQEKVNRFIAEMRADGTLDDMYQRWVIDQDETMPEIELPQDPDLTINVGTTGDVPPYSFYAAGGVTGYDVELAYRFAAWMGAGHKVYVYDWGGIIPAAQVGSIDLIMSNLQTSEERMDNFLFSDALFEERQGVLVRAEGAEAPVATTPLDDVVRAFENTFVKEDRWKLFVSGIQTTLLISVLSVLFGTALGFALFLLTQGDHPWVDTLLKACTWLVQGMPTVVLLMFLYYVVFGRVSIGGVVVSVVAFTLTFGSSVLGLFRMGVGTIDPGQWEASLALGHSARQTLFRVILPQAIPHVLPAFEKEVTGLLKATSIVGYIAVQDLTKMSDIVRSRTYEAFFPLIAITIIYFLLELVIMFVVGRLRVAIDQRRRRSSRLMRGVRTDD